MGVNGAELALKPCLNAEALGERVEEIWDVLSLPYNEPFFGSLNNSKPRRLQTVYTVSGGYARFQRKYNNIDVLYFASDNIVLLLINNLFYFQDQFNPIQ